MPPTQVGKNVFVPEMRGQRALTFVNGTSTTVAASDTVSTGLCEVVGVIATLESAPVIGCDRASASIGNQSSAPVAGSILVQTWKPTSTSDTTPVAATTFSKVVKWLAWGYA